MRINPSKQTTFRRLLRKGFTLVEMAVTLVLTLMIATTGTMMMSQQVNFYTWLNAQKFVLEEAPIANSLVVRLLSQADAFRIHGSRAQALADTNGLVADGTVLVVGFSQPDGSREYGLLEFTVEDGEETGSLQFHKLNQDASAVESSWEVTGGASNVTFSMNNGILLIDMVGPYGGSIQYAATSSL